MHNNNKNHIKIQSSLFVIKLKTSFLLLIGGVLSWISPVSYIWYKTFAIFLADRRSA